MKRIRWTKEEDEILKKTYEEKQPGLRLPDGKIDAVRLGNRSRSAIKNRITILGLREPYKKWTTKDIKVLKENYPIMGVNVINLIDASKKQAIISMALHLKLRRAR